MLEKDLLCILVHDISTLINHMIMRASQATDDRSESGAYNYGSMLENNWPYSIYDINTVYKRYIQEVIATKQ